MRGQGSFVVFIRGKGKSELMFPWEKLELSVGDLCYHSWSQGRWNTPLHKGSCEDLTVSCVRGEKLNLRETFSFEVLLQGICDAFDMYILKHVRLRNRKAPIRNMS